MAQHDTTSPLREQDAARYLGVSVGKLRLDRRENRGAAYVRIGRAVRYTVPDLDAYLGAVRVRTRDSRPEDESAPTRSKHGARR